MADMWRAFVSQRNQAYADEGDYDLRFAIAEALILLESGHLDLARELLAVMIGIPLLPDTEIDLVQWLFAEEWAPRLRDDLDDLVSRFRINALAAARADVPWATPGDDQWVEAAEMATRDAAWYRTYLVALLGIYADLLQEGTV